MADDPRALIEKAIAAKGGLKRLKDIRTVQAEQTTTVHQIGNTVTFKGRTSIAYPDKYRVESDTPRGKVVQVSSGGDYWVEDASGAHDAPPEVRESIQQGLQRDIIPLLIKAAEGSLVVRGVDADAPLAGVMISGSGMAPVTIFINQDTGFIERVRYDAPGNAGTTEEQFSDYRTVDGVRVPFHTVLRRPGAPVVERDITHIHFNVALPTALFTRGS